MIIKTVEFEIYRKLSCDSLLGVHVHGLAFTNTVCNIISESMNKHVTVTYIHPD